MSSDQSRTMYTSSHTASPHVLPRPLFVSHHTIRMRRSLISIFFFDLSLSSPFSSCDSKSSPESSPSFSSSDTSSSEASSSGFLSVVSSFFGVGLNAENRDFFSKVADF
jgi:hypothetical protein